MKITSFSFTLRQTVTKDGYGDNYYVNIDENGAANVSHPYKSIEHKEQAFIFGIIQNAISKYAELIEVCDRANRVLGLEEYAPKVSVTEAEPESVDVSAAPQPSHGGSDVVDSDRAVSTGAEIKDAPFEEDKSVAQIIEENVIKSLGLK